MSCGECTNAVEMNAIVKRFGRVLANDAASIAVKKGDIHALVGENGAGKSTLMKILYGLYAPDSGEIAVGGRPAALSGPSDAIGLGIGMVHQHFMLVPTLTVAENVVLGMEPHRGVFFDKTSAIRRTEEISEKYGLALDPRAMVGDLSVGEEQRLEILKVLYRGADILILDEPTAVLTPQETASLFGVLGTLQSQGKTIILITHKLAEVMSVSQMVTVMRKGKTIGSVATRETSESGLAQMMVGRPVVFEVERRLKSPDEIEASAEVLSLENISAKSDRGTAALSGISLEIKGGEVLGIAGVEGNGQTELIEVVAGLRRPVSGEMKLLGKKISDRVRPRDMFAMGLSHVPQDRHRRGLILDYSVSENMILGRHREKIFSSPVLMRFDEIEKFSRGLADSFDVHPRDVGLRVANLSGGNQQKVVVARELSRKPKLLIAAQPTRGVDVGAIEFIHKKIIEVRDSGTAVLLVSAELSELLSLSDMIGVLYRGRLSKIYPVKELDEEKLGLLMAGLQ